MDREIPIACRANNFNYVNLQNWTSFVIQLLAGGKFEGKDALRQADRLALLCHERLWNNGNLGFISPEDGLAPGTLASAFAAYDLAAQRHDEEKNAQVKAAADA